MAQDTRGAHRAPNRSGGEYWCDTGRVDFFKASVDFILTKFGNLTWDRLRLCEKLRDPRIRLMDSAELDKATETPEPQ